MDNYFSVLNAINVNDKTENKNGLTYLSWAWAWGEVKKLHPDATYTIYENKDGWFYHTDGKTCWVKTGVAVNGVEHIEYLPVMDFRNRSIPAEQVTSFDVNKAIQRSLTKAVARHGLGLYIYAGEDLPENAVETVPVQNKPIAKAEPKEPLRVSVVQPDELKQRNAELKKLLTERQKTMDDYKAVAGDRTVTSMTATEYQDWLADLKKAWS
jgi:hypothetical protein